MNIDENGAIATESMTAGGTGATAVTSRTRWTVVNKDSQYGPKTVLVTRWRWYAAWWTAWLRIFDGDDIKIVRTMFVTVDEADAASECSAASRSRWTVVNKDSQYQKTLLVTRWRWYATWWAAWLRIFDGDDIKIVRLK